MSLTKEAIDLLLATGRAQQTPYTDHPGEPYFINPSGQAVSLTTHYDPKFVRQNVTLLDAVSFAIYVNVFKRPESVIFASIGPAEAIFTAILDYHDGTSPTWRAERCCHRATFKTNATPEWKVWQAANRQPMGQVEFATWLEDNLGLFVQPPDDSEAPSGAELLQLVRTLNGHSTARFNTNLRLNTGAYSVSYDEDVEVSGNLMSKPGSIQLPAQIVAGFALFEGAAPYKVSARLKTRINERKLQIWFETIALERIVRESIDAIVARVEELTKIKPLLGTPN